MLSHLKKKLPLKLIATFFFPLTILSAEDSRITFDTIDSQVSSALLNHGINSSSELIVLSSETTGNVLSISDEENVNLKLTELQGTVEIYHEWQKRNQHRVPIEAAFNVTASYVLLDTAKITAIFSSGQPAIDWDNFFTEFPNAPGILRLSKPGYDKDELNALIYIEHQCGIDCGSARFVHLEKKENLWNVRGSILIWMAY
jgi:hypothetical protein